MEFHAIRMVGPFNNEILSSLTTYDFFADRSRMLYIEGINDFDPEKGTLWFADFEKWKCLSVHKFDSLPSFDETKDQDRIINVDDKLWFGASDRWVAIPVQRYDTTLPVFDPIKDTDRLVSVNDDLWFGDTNRWKGVTIQRYTVNLPLFNVVNDPDRLVSINDGLWVGTDTRWKGVSIQKFETMPGFDTTNDPDRIININDRLYFGSESRWIGLPIERRADLQSYIQNNHEDRFISINDDLWVGSDSRWRCLSIQTYTNNLPSFSAIIDKQRIVSVKGSINNDCSLWVGTEERWKGISIQRYASYSNLNSIYTSFPEHDGANDPDRIINAEDDLWYGGETRWFPLKLKGEGPDFIINQPGHGFDTTNAIRFNGTIWVKALANSESTLGSHIVIEVIDADNFRAGQVGRYNVPGHSLTVGEYYFLSSSSAGNLVLDEPSVFSNPLIFVETNSYIHILPYRPSTPGGRTAPGFVNITATGSSSYTLGSWASTVNVNVYVNGTYRNKESHYNVINGNLVFNASYVPSPGQSIEVVYMRPYNI